MASGTTSQKSVNQKLEIHMKNEDEEATMDDLIAHVTFDPGSSLIVVPPYALGTKIPSKYGTQREI